MLDEWHSAKRGDFGLASWATTGARWQMSKAMPGTSTRSSSTRAIPAPSPTSTTSASSSSRSFPPGLRWSCVPKAHRCMAMERALVIRLRCGARTLSRASERPSVAASPRPCTFCMQSEDARLPALPPRMYGTMSTDAAFCASVHS
ncbi:hypothetical protein U9M48_000903 [Paspalum notatum var. saurae]|uniref:Uncharacterized protein n=1 Tax=Paspalum notatum var. saurae TaxID=547442 RepID=A0AAQ3PFP4_PASNO